MGSFSLFHWMIVLVILLLPATLVLFSPQVKGYEKVAWTFVAIFTSWIGFVVFLIVSSLRTNFQIADKR